MGWICLPARARWGLKRSAAAPSKFISWRPRPRRRKLIEQNLQSLGIASGYKILRDDLSGILWRLQRQHVAADVVFLDPPYRMQHAYEETLTALADSSVVWAMSLVVAEHEKKFDPGDEFGSLRRTRKLVQGNAALSFYRIGGRPDLSV